MDIKIIYEDKNILVAYKPNNISSQKDKNGKTGLLEKLQERYKELYIINRLDTNVSGLVLFAKNKIATEKMSNLIKNNQVEKIYYAVVDVSDCSIKDSDALEHWLFKNQRLNTSKVVNKNSPSSKVAKLKYETIKNFKHNNGDYSLVKIKLETGRHHQIRVQFSHICNGLYGDTKYNKNFKRSRENIALCAKELNFVHPFTKEKLSFSCELPNETIFKN